jgi:DNA (cytosine-5)-methyltransferase 1
MKHLGDITKMNGFSAPPVDVITFGSPCQDLSVAGKRAGLAGERSGLFMEAVRIIKEMREATNGQYPKYAVWENVPGAFSSNKGEDFRAVLEELARIKEAGISIPGPDKSKWAKAGLITGDDWSIAWRTMDAQYWGVPQRRLRISLVLDLTGWCAGEILFEPESLRGHFAPSITPWQATAGIVEKGAGTADRAFTLKIRSRCEGGGKGALVQTEKSATLSTLQDQTLFAAEPTFCIQGNTLDRPAGAFALDCRNMTANAELSATLQAKSNGGQSLNYINPVCYAATTEPNMVICDDCSPAIRSRDYKDPNIVCYDARGNGDGMTSPTITGDHNSRITDYTSVVVEKIRWIVRRLTPTECERLQGYPDGWTDLGEWVDSKGKPHKPADTPRYKALGNSIALPQWYYVLGGIADRLSDNATLGSLFDGIGGFPYVWAKLHNDDKSLCVWASEIEEFPIAVTQKQFPENNS